MPTRLIVSDFTFDLAKTLGVDVAAHGSGLVTVMGGVHEERDHIAELVCLDNPDETLKIFHFGGVGHVGR